MGDNLANCWEIMDCGKAKGGVNAVLGECIAAQEGLGHSCWAIAGTLCCGEVRVRMAEKEQACITCEVFKIYNRINGTLREAVKVQHPEEDAKYTTMLLERMNSRLDSEAKKRASDNTTDSSLKY